MLEGPSIRTSYEHRQIRRQRLEMAALRALAEAESDSSEDDDMRTFGVMSTSSPGNEAGAPTTYEPLPTPTPTRPGMKWRVLVNDTKVPDVFLNAMEALTKTCISKQQSLRFPLQAPFLLFKYGLRFFFVRAPMREWAVGCGPPGRLEVRSGVDLKSPEVRLLQSGEIVEMSGDQVHCASVRALFLVSGQ